MKKGSPYTGLKKGAFTKQAKRAGVSVDAFANRVLRNPKNFKTTTVRRARWYKRFAK